MIRILHVVTDMGRGGIETMLMNYYRHIDRDVIQFDFLTHRDYRSDYDDEIESLGGVIYHLPKLNPFSKFYKNALRRFFMEHTEYRIVHVHQDCLSSVILKVAKQCNIPVRIAHSHNSNQTKDVKYPIKLYYKQFISKYATHLMACSEEAGKWMFGKNAKFTVLNNAIDAAAYSFNMEKREAVRKSFAISKNTLVLGHIGRFSYRKNHTFLIDIFRQVTNQSNAKLLLVGEGNLKDEIEEKVKRFGLQSRVIFAGVRSDVADILQGMDVFVFPSNYEGLPVTIIEAQAAGLPCFISDKVPIECKKTDLVQQIPLSASPEQWAKAIIGCKKDRNNRYEEIKDSGFDIVENAKWLEEYYLEKIR